MIFPYLPVALQVHNAGHMVPMDQPKASLEMLTRWMNGDLAAATSEPQGLASVV